MNTDVQGRTNLRFLDQSILDIRPGSDVRIDRFVYNPDRTTAGATISLVKGVMRYNSRGTSGGAVQVQRQRAPLASGAKARSRELRFVRAAGRLPCYHPRGGRNRP